MRPNRALMRILRFVPRKPNLYITVLLGIIYGIVHTSINKEQQIPRGWQKRESASQQDVLPHRTYLITRTCCTQKVFLLIMVLTAPANFDRRTVIRETWGTDPSLQKRWKTVFLLGQAAGGSIQNKYLAAEDMIYRDFIRGAQKETYNNLPLKTQMGLEWAAKYCDYHFLLKADDDVFINPYYLMDFLGKSKTPKTNLYTGLCKHGDHVRRSGKYKITLKEYNKASYPDYCTGPAYVLSSDVVSKLVELFDIKQFFKLEDVYMGMMVDKISGVKAKNVPLKFLTQKREWTCRHIPSIVSIHWKQMSIQCIEKLFNEAMKERIEHKRAEIKHRI